MLKSGTNTEIKSGVRGQKVVTSSGRDDSSYDGGGGKSSFVGGEMGGGPADLSHSLKGTTANQKGS